MSRVASSPPQHLRVGMLGRNDGSCDRLVAGGLEFRARALMSLPPARRWLGAPFLRGLRAASSVVAERRALVALDVGRLGPALPGTWLDARPRETAYSRLVGTSPAAARACRALAALAIAFAPLGSGVVAPAGSGRSPWPSRTGGHIPHPPTSLKSKVRSPRPLDRLIDDALSSAIAQLEYPSAESVRNGSPGTTVGEIRAGRCREQHPNMSTLASTAATAIAR